jgi:hypothetical protein
LSRSSGASPYQVENEYEEQSSSHSVESGADFSPTRKKKKLARSEGERFWGPIEPAMKRYEKLIPIQQFF